jgi:hypothetical protein
MQEDKKVKDLNEEFEKSISTYNTINIEKRTNLNLYLGHHYAKSSGIINKRLESQGVDKSSAVRVTKNHLFKIAEYISNSILSASSDGKPFPENPDELQDQKAAELHDAVLSKWKHDNDFKELVRKLALEFVVDGEIAVKRFWNENLGETLRVEESVDEETGEVTQTPIKAGDVEVEKIFGWDLIFPENAKSAHGAEWLGYQKMMSTKKLKEMAPEELKEKIVDSSDRTFEIFDPSTGGYSHKKGMTLLREKYTRPCKKYLTGYYEFFNEDTIIFEGELPEGHPFPIKVKGFTDVPTSPRAVSIFRQIKPLQLVVNFGASQTLLTQMTLGQDKLIMLGGADLQYKGSQRGVEQFRTNSLQSPTILAGRSGAQFSEASNQAISEMYQIANVPEIGAERPSQVDPQTALYQSVKDKQRFSKYAEKFFEFTREIMEDVLALKKMYMSEDELVRVIGRTERVNVPEFKSSEKIGYQIRIIEVDEDATGMIGKHLELREMLQYGGKGMSPEQVALIGRNMPFLNDEEIFQEALIDYDTYKNIVLAIDRGEQVPVQPFDNADYLLPKLTSRMRKADFRFLDPQIQQNYQGFIQQLQQVKAQQLQQLKMQQSQLIPTTGALVSIPIYREVPNASGGVKSEQIKLPIDSLNDLVAKMEMQGTTLDPMKRMEQATQANIANIINQGQQPQIAAS